jgi:hypothetical protein
MCASRFVLPLSWARRIEPLLVAALLALPLPCAAGWRFEGPLLAQNGPLAQYETPPLLPAVGDLNSDGVPDIVGYGSHDGGSPRIAIWLGNGDGTLRPPRILPCPWASGHNTVADFDGDGAMDIGASAWMERGVLFGDGTGTHWDPVPLPGSAYASSATTGDFDEDGRPDLAVYSEEGKLLVFLYRPGRTFQSVVDVQDSLDNGLVYSMTVADLDLDGHADIVVSKGYGTNDLVLLFGRGDGTFRARCIGPVSYFDARGATVADLTGDGRPDVIVARRDIVSVHPGLGDGTFGPAQVVDLGGRRALDVATHDFDRDGVIDLLIQDSHDYTLVTYPGLGGGALGLPRVTQVGRSLFPLLLADLNGDERSDVTGMSTEARGMFVALGDGAGGFGVPPTLLPMDGGNLFLDPGDADEDGAPDFLAVTNVAEQVRLEVVLSRPDRTFIRAPARSFAPASMPYEARLQDVDADGHLDAVLATPSSLVLFPGNGDGTLDDPAEILAGSVARTTSLVDANGDGILDLLWPAGTEVHVKPGLGGATFGPDIVSAMGVTFEAVAAGDLDGDGDADLVLGTPYVSSGSLRLANGTGDGHFELSPASMDVQFPIMVRIADVDGNGRDDVVCAVDFCAGCWENLVGPGWKVWLQQADGSLAAPVKSPWDFSAGFLPRFADIDGDGTTDILYEQYAGGVSVSRGFGGGRFEPFGGQAGPLAIMGGLAVADFDRDGRVDVAAGQDSSLLLLWGRDPVPPSVALLGPEPATPLHLGQQVTIPWQAEDDLSSVSIDLFISRHGHRGPFAPLALGLPNFSDHPWTVTGPLSDSVAFKVVARDSAGNVGRATSPALLRIVEALAVGDAVPPARLAIAALAPNPVHGRLSARLALPRAGRVTLALHDLQGRLVARLLDAERPAGETVVDWSPRAASPAPPPGLYFLRLAQGGQQAVARVSLTH